MSDRSESEQRLIEENDRLRARVAELQRAHISPETLERLREFETVVEIMQLGVTITDLNGTILYCNPADAAMHGYTVEDVLQQDISIFAPSGRRKPMSPLELDRLASWRRESKNVRKDGSEFPVQLMSDIVRDERGEPIAVVTTCADITKRKLAEDTLKAELARVEKFAAKHRKDASVQTTAQSERQRRLFRVAAVIALVVASALVGAVIGNGSGSASPPPAVPVPMNPADTVLPEVEGGEFRPALPPPESR